VSSGANVGTGFPFVKKLISSNKDGAGTATSRTPAADAIGTSCKVPNMVGILGPGVGGGGPLPFIIKSPFNMHSKKGVESLVGAWPRASEILSSMKVESSPKSSAAGDAMMGGGVGSKMDKVEHMATEEWTHDKEAAWIKEQQEEEHAIADQGVCNEKATKSEIRRVEGRSALWLALIAVLLFLSFKDALNSNRLFFSHLTCCHLMRCRWCCGCYSPNQLLGLIPAVLDSGLDKNFSKSGMMEGIGLVMLRLTKMVPMRYTWGAAMRERTRRGQTRSGKTMETTEIVVWRTRGVTAIHLPSTVGGVDDDRGDSNQSLLLDSPWPCTLGYDFFPDLVGQ
jgi:hypothetical protein